MRRGCTASAGVPGSSWRPFPEHSSLPPPSTQRPTGPKRPTARERGGARKKSQDFPRYFSGPAFGELLSFSIVLWGLRAVRGAGFIYFFNLRSLAPPIAPPRALITHGQPPRVSRRFRENLNSGSILVCVFRSAFLQLALGHGSKVLFLIDFHQETWGATHFCPLFFRNVLRERA